MARGVAQTPRDSPSWCAVLAIQEILTSRSLLVRFPKHQVRPLTSTILAGTGRQLKVLQVVEATLTGVGRHSLDLCRGLAARGCRVDLIYSPTRMDTYFEQLLGELREMPSVNVIPCPMRRSMHPSDARATWFVRRHIGTSKPDVVHGHSSKGGAIARLAAIGSGVKAVYTPNAIQTINPQISRRTRWIVGQMEKLLAHVPGAVVAVSTEEEEHILSLGISNTKVCLIPNGIDPIQLPSQQEARTTLGLDPKALIAGFVGRFSEQKAIDVLIKALPKVRTAIPEMRLVLIGQGELVPDLKVLADSLGVSESIIWLGQQPGFQSMPAFDMFVLPSRYEGLPFVMIEALMAGLPVVTTNQASPSLLVESEVNGLVVEAESPEELAAAVIRVLKDEQLRHRFSQAAIDRASAFTLDAMVDRTLNLYKRMIDGRN